MQSFLRNALVPAQASAFTAGLGDDELELMSIDANQALNDLERDTMALNRLQDSANAIEDTRFIAGHIKAASNVDLALVDNSINHCLAGEGISSETVMPNMQSYEGEAINMQSLKTMASSVWQAIKDLIARIRTRIVKFFKSRWGDSAKLRKRLKALIDRAENMTGKTINESKTTIGREVKYLTMADKVHGKGKDVIEGIDRYNTIASALYETWIRRVNDFGVELETAMSSYDASASSTGNGLNTVTMQSLVTVLTTIPGIDKLFRATKSEDQRSPDGVIRRSCPLAGNVSIFAVSGFTIPDTATDFEKAKVAAKSRVSIEPTFAKTKDLEEEADIETWSADQVRTMCNDLLSVLDIIDRYDDSKYMKDTDKQTSKITKAGDRLSKDRYKQDEINPDVNSTGIALQQFASAYTSWTANGLASFASNFNSMANAVVVIGSKCLSNHK